MSSGATADWAINGGLLSEHYFTTAISLLLPEKGKVCGQGKSI